MSIGTTPTPVLEYSGHSAPVGSRFRWVICGLLFAATTINYIDRQVYSILAPTLQKQLHWSEVQYSYTVICFNLSYALGGVIFSGPLIDYLGTRLGYSISLIVWSFAAMAHGLARSIFGFALVRLFLGLGESGNFPAAMKTVSEWFPKKERALATGIFNSGSGIGAIIAPALVPWMTMHWGWQYAFIVTGAIGLVWILFWWPLYRRPAEHPRLSPSELAYIQSDPPEPQGKVSWGTLLQYPQTWAFLVGKFFPDAVWGFYIGWAPKFLDTNFGVSLKHVGLPLVVIFVGADIGSIFGGWISSSLIHKGWTVNWARKITMLGCALAVMPIIYAPHSKNLWVAVTLIGIAAGAHQAWSANIFTFATDMFPRRAVASMAGLGGFAGAIGGITLAWIIGHVLQATGSYTIIFAIAGSGYLVALGLIQLLAPRLVYVRLHNPVEPSPVSTAPGV